MIDICNLQSEIWDLKITIDEAITTQILNSLNTFFGQFLGILNHKAREKQKFPTLRSLAKFSEDKKLQIKYQDKAITYYTK